MSRTCAARMRGADSPAENVPPPVSKKHRPQEQLLGRCSPKSSRRPCDETPKPSALLERGPRQLLLAMQPLLMRDARPIAWYAVCVASIHPAIATSFLPSLLLTRHDVSQPGRWGGRLTGFQPRNDSQSASSRARPSKASCPTPPAPRLRSRRGQSAAPQPPTCRERAPRIVGGVPRPVLPGGAGAKRRRSTRPRKLIDEGDERDDVESQPPATCTDFCPGASRDAAR